MWLGAWTQGFNAKIGWEKYSSGPQILAKRQEIFDILLEKPNLDTLIGRIFFSDFQRGPEISKSKKEDGSSASNKNLEYSSWFHYPL